MTTIKSPPITVPTGGAPVSSEAPVGTPTPAAAGAKGAASAPAPSPADAFGKTEPHTSAGAPSDAAPLARGEGASPQVVAELLAMSARVGGARPGAEVAALGDVDIRFDEGARLTLDSDVLRIAGRLRDALVDGDPRRLREAVDVHGAVSAAFRRENLKLGIEVPRERMAQVFEEWRTAGPGPVTDEVLREVSTREGGAVLRTPDAREALMREAFLHLTHTLDATGRREGVVLERKEEMQQVMSAVDEVLRPLANAPDAQRLERPWQAPRLETDNRRELPDRPTCHTKGELLAYRRRAESLLAGLRPEGHKPVPPGSDPWLDQKVLEVLSNILKNASGDKKESVTNLH